MTTSEPTRFQTKFSKKKGVKVKIEDITILIDMSESQGKLIIISSKDKKISIIKEPLIPWSCN